MDAFLKEGMPSLAAWLRCLYRGQRTFSEKGQSKHFWLCRLSGPCHSCSVLCPCRKAARENAERNECDWATKNFTYGHKFEFQIISHVMKYSFDFKKPFKNVSSAPQKVKTILSLWAIQKQVAGGFGRWAIVCWPWSRSKDMSSALVKVLLDEWGSLNDLVSLKGDDGGGAGYTDSMEEKVPRMLKDTRRAVAGIEQDPWPVLFSGPGGTRRSYKEADLTQRGKNFLPNRAAPS